MLANKWLIDSFAALLAVSFVLPVFAETRELNWEDLVPPQEFEDPYTELTDEQFYDLGTILRTREFVASQTDNLNEEMLARAEELEKKLDAQGVDVNALLAMREEITEMRRAQSQAVVGELDGQSIRMPGYVLPLEFDGQRVTEFFLVPYVGACMHAPTPPPNQMVHVISGNGIEIQGMYDPVWVMGEMSTTSRTSEAMFSDGGLEISAGYSIQATDIEPYE